MQKRKEAHQLTEKYSDQFAILECQLIAAKNLANFNGIKPTIFDKRLLGAGGFFNVHPAKWGDKENLAVKIQHSTTFEDHPNASYMEAHYHRAITNAHQDNVVPLSYLYYENKIIYIFMPKYKQSLQKYLQENIMKIKFDQIFSFALIIATVLNDIHQNDLVHRDIKSSNILLDDVERCYLSDFGTAKEGSLNNSIVGSFPLAHEVLEGAVMQHHNLSSVYDGKAVDIFGYGILLFELLPKTEYYRPNTEAVYELDTLFDDDKLIPLPSDMNDYKRLVLDCLQRNYVNRPSASGIIQRIEALIRQNEVKRCSICLERERTVRTLPCGHKVLCQQCREDLRRRNYDLCVLCKRLMNKDVHDDCKQTFYLK
jgi:serine/threonine protein kinase